jgi:hypothetical protein
MTNRTIQLRALKRCRIDLLAVIVKQKSSFVGNIDKSHVSL